jgi:DedD protein
MLTSRSGSQGHSAPQPPQSIEAVRRRALHRLIGASVLVLVGVVGFPLLFDTQPRPMALDIPIEIPSRDEALTRAVPSAAKPAPALAGAVAFSESLGGREEVVPSPAAKAPESKPSVGEPVVAVPAGGKQAVQGSIALNKDAPPAVPAAPPAVVVPTVRAPEKTSEKAPDKPVDKAAERGADRAAEKPADKSLAKAPESRDDDASAAKERIVVQVGAFAEAERAREARLKLERIGLKTYTHVAETPEGRRIRVRLGPFASRAEAEKAAARAKAQGLPANLLWL